MLKPRNYYCKDFKINTAKLRYASQKTIKKIVSDVGVAKSYFTSCERNTIKMEIKCSRQR